MIVNTPRSDRLSVTDARSNREDIVLDQAARPTRARPTTPSEKRVVWNAMWEMLFDLPVEMAHSSDLN